MYRSDTFDKIAVCALAALWLTACGEDKSEPIQLTGDTGTDVSQTDAGESDDARTDATGEVVRRVIDRELFGEMPIDNYVLDPSFRSVRNWIAYEVEGQRPTAYVHSSREVYPETPMNAAVLRAPQAQGSADIRVIASVLFRPRPLDASIWIGRPEHSTAEVDIRLTGVRSDQPTDLKSARLEVEPSSSTVMNGIEWKRYSATVSGLFGSGYMFISASGEDDLFLHGAVITEQEPSPNALVRPPTPLREASALDRASVRAARRWQRRHRPDPRRHFFSPGADPLEGLGE